MTTVYNINCGNINAHLPYDLVCHCLLLKDKNGIALVDAGMGYVDAAGSESGTRWFANKYGRRFNRDETALAKLKKLGIRAKDVQHVILTHMDPDHIGGLADFPRLTLHVSSEEYAHFQTGNDRYLGDQLDPNHSVKTYAQSEERWFGLEARRINVQFESDIFLIPLFGHTMGHCGVAISQDDKWLLHIGDAYYLKAELEELEGNSESLALIHPEDEEQRIRSLEVIRRLIKDYHDQIEIISYHDPRDLPYTRQYVRHPDSN
ncbi:hypothetical protein C900_02936 [Fulvivirga imtechensis AK7]|uniref:Metallo-beta-lactamase domain-containing protein n=1 Tax=Fulvivirga imtechensis AK7 TaxID=1237149 RepID=L8JQT8_9BACT|nr:MBL fold metallo-hydrolase [Fulvivirga imtechensis]ELR71321.1 hypothetical protein C900_02936 [Fulvivirga imtechensis AK7]